MSTKRPHADVPFYGNLPDDTHCFQASFRMILKYFLPDRDFSWEELRKMSAKVEGKATWPAQMLINVEQMGFDVVLMEAFDAKAFIEEGEEYLRRAFPGEVAEWQIKESDIVQERQLYQKLLDSTATYIQRVPTQDDIQQYLQQGYLVELTVNKNRLNHQEGYLGHGIVIYAMDDTTITFHDPGLPHQARRTESREHFEAAWADPNDEAKNLIAIRYKEPTDEQ